MSYKDEIPNIEDFNANAPDPNEKIYDMEININSILGFLRGWEIKYSNGGRKKK